MATETPTLNKMPRLTTARTANSRENMLRRYLQTRQTTTWICEPLTVEDCVIQTSMECSPVKWQLAHTTWFFETFVLLPNDPTYHEFHPKFSYFFNSYYNTVGDRTPRDLRGLMSRPTLNEVWAYRRSTDEAMQTFLHNSSEEVLQAAWPIIELGVNHEQQHQELIITDVKTVLAMNPLRPVYRTRSVEAAPVPSMKWVGFDEGLYEFGAQGTQFHFDNESPRHRQYVNAFELTSRLITNGEYKEFMSDGGYENPALWLSDGWAQVLAHGWQAPKYWERSGEEWWAMTLQGFRPVEDSEPVTHISHFEADAFATWAGARLPTEFEWELAAQDTPLVGNFLEGGQFHPVPLSLSNANTLHQLFGDCWEWTRSSYLPYPGYRHAEGALGEYNGKFMSNQIILRGGSCATPADHVRATYRNFFPPESRWQFSGIRLAKDV